ncbi:PDZ domain-containing protein [bacterium]|nr:PDZ domain-containing protein [bacterium]
MKKILTILLLLASVSTVYAANNFGYGIQLSKNENDLVIKNIIPNSLAEKIGLKPGQKIIKLNGKKIQKLKISDIENLDNSYKNLQLIMSDNKQYNLKPENVDLLKFYNDIQDTYNTNTAYPVFLYKTDKIILPTDIDSKHVKYTNAYFNYADIISNKNAKLYTELFKVTQEKVVKSIIDAKNNPMNEYAELYNSIYSSDTQNYDIYGSAFKDFLRLAIYNEQNKEVIARQISEFNSTQRKQYAQLAYNTRIIANLYSYANRELGLYLMNNTINANKTDKWRDELKTQNRIYNKMYNELLQSLSKNKIEINKPGPLSNREQITAGVTPKEKWVDDKQIVILAQERGYDPNENPVIKKINDAKIAAQKQKEAQEAAKKAEAEKAKKAAAVKKSTFSRTGNYAYDASNAYSQAVMGLLDPEIAKKLVNEAIQYYYPKKNISYENHRKYCEVLGLRINISLSNNPQQLQKDLYEFNTTCK